MTRPGPEDGETPTSDHPDAPVTAESAESAADGGAPERAGRPGPGADLTTAPPVGRSTRELAAEFDAFYKDSRTRLLQQTLALTGDLPASRGAVRDAYLVAWHHWRKIVRHDDPEAAVRPYAWRHARRRAGTRPWRRERGIDPEVRATLDALAALSVEQRKALLLSQLAHTTMADLAREIGMPVEDAERELQSATAQFSLERDVPAGGVRAVLEPLAGVAAGVSWPRPTIIRRAGAARRRAHTTVGAVVVVAALVATGTLVTDASGVRPTLDRGTTSAGRGSVPVGPTVSLPEPALLTTDDVGSVQGGRWRETSTTDNSEGDGRALLCQRQRYLDDRGDAAFVRTFRPEDGGGQGGGQGGGKAEQPTVVQVSEASDDGQAAARAVDRALSWLTDCDTERVQLLGAQRVEQVGDAATILALRDWADPVTTYTVGVARTGAFTTATMVSAPGAVPPPTQEGARLLAASVDRLCGLTEAGSCATDEPTLSDISPPPAARYPALLNPADLPPVTGVDEPWTSARVTAPAAESAPRCDDLSFAEPYEGTRWRKTASRPFVVLDAGLPDAFGLTETVGALPEADAEALVADVRSAYAQCPERDLGSDVVRVADVNEGDTSMSAWQVTTEISEDETFRSWTAILRDGTSVAQIYFSAAEGATFAEGAFVGIANRALDRLAELPRPRKG